MKTIYMYLLISLVFAFASCKDDSSDNPVFGENEIPYIYANYPGKMTVTAGEPMEYKMQVSPADGSVSVKWMLDGTVITTTNLFSHTIETPGTYILRFEATRNGITNHREYTIVIN